MNVLRLAAAFDWIKREWGRVMPKEFKGGSLLAFGYAVGEAFPPNERVFSEFPKGGDLSNA